LLRYGSLHGNILGVEAVLADGRILENLSTLRKDNTGYDLKQLFIGAEGTLGVITKVALLCPSQLPSVNVALLALPSFENCLNLLKHAKKDLGEILSAFEFYDNFSLNLLNKHFPQLKDPLSDDPSEFYVIIETTGSKEEHDKDKLQNFLEKIMTHGICSGGTLANNKSEMSGIWSLRESITSACGKHGKVYKYDISLPTEKMYQLVEIMRKKFDENFPGEVFTVGYGHLGDGNLHLNMVAPKYDEKYLTTIEPFVYEYTSSLRGSISAEHGIGVMKPNALHYSKSLPFIETMRQIKQVFDPNGILNPYKVVPY